MPSTPDTSVEKTNGVTPIVEPDETPSSSKLRFKSTLAREEAAAYFEAIVAGMRNGSIHMKQGGDAMDLELPSFVKVDVRATRKGGRASLSFELQWRAEDCSELEIIPG